MNPDSANAPLPKPHVGPITLSSLFTTRNYGTKNTYIDIVKNSRITLITKPRDKKTPGAIFIKSDHQSGYM